MTKTLKKNQIPTFKSIQDEAAFWDTHDTTEFENEFEPVDVKFAKNLTKVVSVRLDNKTIASLEGYAQQKGIGLTTLIRMWVLEHLADS